MFLRTAPTGVLETNEVAPGEQRFSRQSEEARLAERQICTHLPGRGTKRRMYVFFLVAGVVTTSPCAVHFTVRDVSVGGPGGYVPKRV